MKFKGFLKSVGYVVFYLAMQIIVYIAYAAVYIAKNSAAPGSDITGMYNGIVEYILANAIPATAISAVLTVFILAVAFKFANKSLLKEIMLKKPAKLSSMLPIPLLGISANLFVEAVFMLLPESALEEYSQASSMIGDGSGFIYYASTIVLIPFVEEIIFRGLAFTRSRRVMRFFPAAIISSLLFGLCHGQSLWIIYATLMGFMLVFVFDRYLSMWASFLLHLCFNGTSVVLVAVLGDKAVNMSLTETIFTLIATAAATALSVYLVIKATKKTRSIPVSPAE